MSSKPHDSGRRPRFAPARPHDAWLRPGHEPRLNDLLDDPLVRLVMRRDGVSMAQLRAVIARVQDCLQSGPCRCAA